MLYQTRLVFFWLDLPEFFDSNPVDLPFVAGVEVELVHERLCQLAPATLAEDGAFGVKLHAPLEAVLGGAVFSNSHVVGGDSFDRAILMVEDFGCSEPWIGPGLVTDTIPLPFLFKTIRPIMQTNCGSISLLPVHFFQKTQVTQVFFVGNCKETMLSLARPG